MKKALLGLVVLGAVFSLKAATLRVYNKTQHYINNFKVKTSGESSYIYDIGTGFIGEKIPVRILHPNNKIVRITFTLPGKMCVIVTNIGYQETKTISLYQAGYRYGKPDDGENEALVPYE